MNDPILYIVAILILPISALCVKDWLEELLLKYAKVDNLVYEEED